MKGSQIKGIRDFLGLKQTQFSEIVGVTHATISRWEKEVGNSAPSEAQEEELHALWELVNAKDVNKEYTTRLLRVVGIKGAIALSAALGFDFKTVYGAKVRAIVLEGFNKHLRTGTGVPDKKRKHINKTRSPGAAAGIAAFEAFESVAAKAENSTVGASSGLNLFKLFFSS